MRNFKNFVENKTSGKSNLLFTFNKLNYLLKKLQSEFPEELNIKLNQL